MVLTASGAVAGAWLSADVAQALGILSPRATRRVTQALRWPAVPSAALTAGYTAFLFGQAEGRDLWQSSMLLWHLLAQAALPGSGSLRAAAARPRLAGEAAADCVSSGCSGPPGPTEALRS